SCAALLSCYRVNQKEAPQSLAIYRTAANSFGTWQLCPLIYSPTWSTSETQRLYKLPPLPPQHFHHGFDGKSVFKHKSNLC
ncbi:hypothetical protein J6590_102516, partial [Homalodisca vitripennis]